MQYSTLIQIQGVQELIKSINRDKIQERMVRIQVPSSANDFLLDLEQICKPWLSYQQTDDIFLTSISQEFWKNFLKKT